MKQNIFNELLDQNIKTCSFTFNEINEVNLSKRLTENTASVGFMYRHIGETMIMFGHFFGIDTCVQNTTIGFQDEGQGLNIKESQDLIEQGYEILNKIINTTSEEGWFELVDTPFFGSVTKAKLFSHVLFHNTYHAGQISLTIKRA